MRVQWKKRTITGAAVVLGLWLGAARLSSPGTWIPTQDLTVATTVRRGLLLHNGKVLTLSSGGAGLVTELYDPATGTWTALAPDSPRRSDYAAVLLRDGRVLAIGGNLFTPITAGCRLFDPETSSWSDADSMNVARDQHTATLLDDGRVLVVGGRDVGFDETTSTEIYDPATDTWTVSPSLSTPRFGHTATLLPDGRVMVTGGITTGFVRTTQTEVFDPAGPSWTTVGPLGLPRDAHSATLLPNGLVLAVGGVSRSSAELFDPSTGTWAPTASLPAIRFLHSATLLPSGLLLVAGGDGATPHKSAHVYDYTTGLWSPGPPTAGSVPDLSAERYGHAATMLPDGRVLIVGGQDGVGSLTSAELYDPDTPAWTAAPNMNVNRSENSATLLKNGQVLVAGGAAENSAEVFDPAALPTPTWTPTLNTMSSTRWRHSATLLLDGRVLVAGSRASTAAGRTADVYDPGGDTWSATPDLASDRSTHTGTLLPDGDVLVVGGQNNASFILATAERYTPGTNSWATTTSMGTARWRHAATLLRDGRVLVTGGFEAAALDTAEVYDPGSETWTTLTPKLTTPRYFHTSTLLPSGKVLLVGGGEFDTAPSATSAELFDPTTGTFSATGSPNVAHESFFTATLLTNGRVLVVGGDANPQVAEVYDPAIGTWTLVPVTTGQRWAHAAALLPDGRVLVSGSVPIGPTAEIFDVGRGEDPSWRPILTSATDPVTDGAKLVAGGSQFQGLSEASSSFGDAQSASNYPLVQIRRLDNEDARWLFVDPATGWSDTGFTSQTLFGLAPGPALVTVFTNGMPSNSRMVTISCNAPIITAEPTAANVCLGAPATFTVATSAVAPAFDWRKGGISMVDGGAISGVSTPTLTVNPTVLGDAGNYDVVISTCSSTTSLSVPLTVSSPLSNVMAGLSGSSNMCSTCTGGTATETHDDGGPVTYQWGFRYLSAGPITDIPGQTGASYDLNGADFPGIGTYFLVVQTTPLCGSQQTSNEIAVTITAAVPGDDVQYFTVTSRSTENVLEWVNPPSYDTVHIRFNSGASCVPPANTLAGTFLVDKTDLDGPGDRDRYPHMTLSDGTTYCYTLFVDKGGSYSAGRSNRGRPMVTTDAVKWAFSTGVFSITAPTVGGAGVVATSNDHVLHSMQRGDSGGEWPAGWLPMPLTGPVQSRSPIIPITVGAANPVVYLSSQDGNVHVVDGSQGGMVGYPWAPEPLGILPTLPGQAAPAGIFTAFGGAYDYLLVGTRDPGNDNRMYAIDPQVGGVVDFFDNGGGANAIGIINGMASVDYTSRRLYFASYARGGPPLDTLWCLDLSGLPTPVMALAWSRQLGDIDSSPVLSGGRIYVGSPLSSGRLYSINATTGGPGAPGPDRTFDHDDGQVKGFVFPDRASGDLYFATDNFVWALNDDGVNITNKFAGPITLASGVVPTSAVLFIPGSHYVYVGGSDGKVYEIDVMGGAPVIKWRVLGDGLATVGAPSLDWPNSLLHVGTEAGVFYALEVPFP